MFEQITRRRWGENRKTDGVLFKQNSFLRSWPDLMLYFTLVWITSWLDLQTWTIHEYYNLFSFHKCCLQLAHRDMQTADDNDALRFWWWRLYSCNLHQGQVAGALWETSADLYQTRLCLRHRDCSRLCMWGQPCDCGTNWSPAPSGLFTTISGHWWSSNQSTQKVHWRDAVKVGLFWSPLCNSSLS